MRRRNPWERLLPLLARHYVRVLAVAAFLTVALLVGCGEPTKAGKVEEPTAWLSIPCPGVLGTLRATQTPGGWLVLWKSGYGAGAAYVPDPEHSWISEGNVR